MPHLLQPPSWTLPASELTDESAWRSRCQIIRDLGLGAIGAALTPSLPALASEPAPSPIPPSYRYSIPVVERNPAYPLDRELTDEVVAASYNNFYEFTTAKDQVWRLAHTLETKPWTVKVHGLVHKPKTFSIDTLLKKLPLEERTYRFRCVEAWSMAVPWIGFPLHALLALVRVWIQRSRRRGPSPEPGERAGAPCRNMSDS